MGFGYTIPSTTHLKPVVMLDWDLWLTGHDINWHYLSSPSSRHYSILRGNLPDYAHKHSSSTSQ